ncbi:MAG: alpha/beta hydrolase family protein [Terrimicrobiaceae bacterium]
MRKWLLILLFGTVIGRPASAASYTPPHPAKDFHVLRETWHDAARGRDVPVKIYLPAGDGPHPVVIFSHGLGGSREGYQYLGEWWAGCGYAAVHLQHAGSDEALWKNTAPSERRGALAGAVRDPSNALNRVKDVTFAIDELSRLNKNSGSPLRGHLDLTRIGMAGHSFGGWTTMAIAGQTLGPRGKSVADPRISAGIEMSAPVPRSSGGRNPLASITIPLLHMTGTLDDSPIGETKAAERRLLFDGMTRAETGLIIFQGADHMTFADPLNGPGLRESAGSGQNAEFQRLIGMASTAFWDAWLRGDAPAKGWLRDGGLGRTLGEKATLEWKAP